MKIRSALRLVFVTSLIGLPMSRGLAGSAPAIFEEGPEMPAARMGHHVATLPDGRVALFGGHGQSFTAL